MQFMDRITPLYFYAFIDSFLPSAPLPDGLVKSKFTVHFPSVESVGRSGVLIIVTFGTIDMAKLRR